MNESESLKSGRGGTRKARNALEEELRNVVVDIYKSFSGGVEPDGHTCRVSVQILSQMRANNYATGQPVIKKRIEKIEKVIPNPERFHRVYDKARGANLKELDSFVAILARAVDDHEFITQINQLRFAKPEEKEREQLEGPDDVGPSDTESSREKEDDRKGGFDNKAKFRLHTNAMFVEEETSQPVAASRQDWVESCSNSHYVDKKSHQVDAMVTDANQKPETADSSVLVSQRVKTPIAQNKASSSQPAADVVKRTSIIAGLVGASNMFLQEKPAKVDTDTVKSFSKGIQEAYLINELLFAMRGIEANHIVSKKKSQPQGEDSEFALPGKLELVGDFDASLREITEKILPLCNAYVCIVHTSSLLMTYGKGRVGQSLAAKFLDYIQKYETTIVQLEHQFRVSNLTIPVLWYYVEPLLRPMLALEGLSEKVLAVRSGGSDLLDIILAYVRYNAGDVQIHQVLTECLTAAAIPYFETLQKWVYYGKIDDPFDEFMIKEDTSKTVESLEKDYMSKYWFHRYELKDTSRIPSFLREIAGKVCMTGKYICALKECHYSNYHFPDADKPERALKYLPTSSRAYTDNIDAAFEFASTTFLKVIRDDESLMSILTSLKSYFLLGVGDFMVHFMDLATTELYKHTGDISISKLQGLLQIALKQSAAVNDSFAEKIRCTLERETLLQQLQRIFTSSHEEGLMSPQSQKSASEAEDSSRRIMAGIDTFVLDCQISWPLSLVLSRRSIFKYQLLFRHIFSINHLTLQVSEAWQRLQSTRLLTGILRGKSNWEAHHLCQRMLHFLQNFEHYLAYEVIEPSWAILEQNIAQAKTVDELIQIHENFLDICMQRSLLFRPKYLNLLERIKGTCFQFVKFVNKFVADISTPGASNPDQHEKGASTNELRKPFEEETPKVFKRSGVEFKQQMMLFISTIESVSQLDPSLGYLVERLDFNNYYRNQGLRQ